MKTRKLFFAAALAVMSVSASAQGTWKAPAPAVGDGDVVNVAKGTNLTTGISNLTVTSNFTDAAMNKGDAGAPAVTFNGVTYDSQAIVQAANTNGNYFLFAPAIDGTLDVALKMGSAKNLFVLELEGFNAEDIMALPTGAELVAAEVATLPIVKITGKNTDGTDISVPDGTWDASAAPNTSGANQWMVLSFPVSTGKLYTVGCNGSKLMLTGINFVGGSSAIGTVLDNGCTVTGYFNLLGQKLADAPAKGAYIETYDKCPAQKFVK